MNWDRVRGNWKQLKGTVQLGWGKLTDDTLLRWTAAAKFVPGGSRQPTASGRRRRAD
jgi:uncharacterized protein YjbJ (UPF0337 family)